MATYKVIQDIEAEDKLLGPFSLRQFIYLIIVAVSLFIGYRLALVHPALVLPLLPHTVFFGLLAAPVGGNQSSEVWLLAKIRFFLKPKKRIWDQTGVKELVTITAPKKNEKALTKELSQSEVRSRLEALASTIDSRGWAIKNVNVNLFAQPSFAMANAPSDRLVDVGDMPQQVSALDVTPGDDILDERNNRTAQNLDRMIHASSKAHRDKLVAQMKQAGQNPLPQAPTSGGPIILPTPTTWPTTANAAAPVVPPSSYTAPRASSIVIPDPTTSPQKMPTKSSPKKNQPLTEEELLDKIHAEKEKPKNYYGHMRVIKPIEEQEAEAAALAAQSGPSSQPPVTPQPDPAILGLASNDDLNVATIAREANKTKGKKEPPKDEVVISLH